jgi:hypothetical protein
MSNTISPIVLASYPRSGNTFIRNILMDVYGLFSWNSYQRFSYLKFAAFHPNCRPEDRFYINKQDRTPEEVRGYLKHEIHKTHDLPGEAAEMLAGKPFVVCIIRDGRDAVVSEAHHRADIVEPGSQFRENLLEAVRAEGGSHFGGWSENVRCWLEKADLVLHFEQLIREPKRCMEKFASLTPLPPPDFGKMPTFESQRSGDGAFVRCGSGEDGGTDFPKLFFRRGEPGGWQDEMDPESHHLFLAKHGSMLKELGYLAQDYQQLKYLI